MGALADKVQVNFESRMLIDGKLVDGEAGTASASTSK